MAGGLLVLSQENENRTLPRKLGEKTHPARREGSSLTASGLNSVLLLSGWSRTCPVLRSQPQSTQLKPLLK